mmetsp:Transcript_16037/g.46147  ORF Transcript_16037/g.46147 Transcript_16037/m.46147 type:complete len:235 (-) Transcript_16037:1042-1746(-)
MRGMPKAADMPRFRTMAPGLNGAMGAEILGAAALGTTDGATDTGASNSSLGLVGGIDGAKLTKSPTVPPSEARLNPVLPRNANSNATMLISSRIVPPFFLHSSANSIKKCNVLLHVKESSFSSAARRTDARKADNDDRSFLALWRIMLSRTLSSATSGSSILPDLALAASIAPPRSPNILLALRIETATNGSAHNLNPPVLRLLRSNTLSPSATWHSRACSAANLPNCNTASGQ